MSNTEKPEIAVIAIERGKLAIFGSRFGFAGPVIQDYRPFTDENKAVDEAKALVAKLGIPLEPQISRPRITKIKVSYS